MHPVMDHPFPKSMSTAEKSKRLQEVASAEDTLAILINADPDAIASALALKRFFWRKVRKTLIYHVNPIQRADNLAFIKLLKIELKRIRYLKPTKITKWALVDSQPHHHELFMERKFDIIIDHHPLGPSTKGAFVDVKETYGANSTVMTEYLRAAKIRPSPKLATALFYGIKTDTDNFVRGSLPNDIKAFRYLYELANMNIIKKIESSEMTKKTLASYQTAMEKLVFLKDIAFVHLDEVDNPDTLVIIADFFMKLAEVTWSIVSGVYDKKLVIILRNAGFRSDAGKTAQKLFGRWGGVAGGHKTAARAEIPLDEISKEIKGVSNLGQLVLKGLKEIR
jgi:nanoRNase/pAp phosphatase (c-di-AMP/oligoRNAs hydrolase)